MNEGYPRALASRLRENAGELEQLVFDRIRALEEEAGDRSHDRLHGLRKVIRPALEYGFTSIELGEQHCPPPPPEVIAHARSAAWTSVDLQRLLDRYLAAYMVFGRFVLRELAVVGDLREEALHKITQSHNIAYERLSSIVGEEYQCERGTKARSPEARRLERIKGLLSVELLEAPDLSYDFSKHHIGLVGTGEEVAEAARALARQVEGELLLVQPSPGKVWAWIGTCAETPTETAEVFLRAELPSTASVALGEPFSGLIGWRRSHRQAKAALAIAGDQHVARYRGAIGLAAIMENDLHRESLEDLYLTPLSAGRRDKGKDLYDAVRAYFAAEWQASSASKALGVKRQTVKKRIDLVEELLGCSLKSCAADLELALRVQSLNSGWFGITATPPPE